jgi:hypothetical protein
MNLYAVAPQRGPHTTGSPKMRKPSFWKLGIGVCVAAITAVVLGGTPAVADPVQSPQAVTGTLSCNDISVDVVIPSLGGLTPRIVVDGHGVLIPMIITFKITDLTTGQVLVADTEQRAYGAQDRATIECSDTHTRVDPTTGHPLEVNIVILNMPTPA